MTAQQPWTPERALSMFKDWGDPDLTVHEFCEKWYVAYNPDDFARIATEALESATAEIERLKAELAKMTQQRDAYCKEMLDAKAQQQPEQCGAWGFCTLPVGHNMGRADIPENHQRPVAVPSDEEIAMAIKSVHMCGDTVTSSSLRLLARRIGVKL